jgi:hypothetical protein
MENDTDRTDQPPSGQAPTLLGYFFEFWMAMVDGGGLVLGGLRARRS